MREKKFGGGRKKFSAGTKKLQGKLKFFAVSCRNIKKDIVPGTPGGVFDGQTKA
jgi:hypothetical protein